MHHVNDDPPPLPADVPAPVRDLVATAMAKAPHAQLPTAAAMADAADAIAGTLAPTALTPTVDHARTTAVPSAGSSRRRQTAAAWAALLLARSSSSRHRIDLSQNGGAGRAAAALPRFPTAQANICKERRGRPLVPLGVVCV